VGEGAMLAAIGIALGLLGSLGATRLISKLLFGVTAADPLTFSATAGIILAVALAASAIPALRAIKVDPVIALRYE
jgi:putative ABC transport system permease protein